MLGSDQHRNFVFCFPLLNPCHDVTGLVCVRWLKRALACQICPVFRKTYLLHNGSYLLHDGLYG
jgi:hypothetical protein